MVPRRAEGNKACKHLHSMAVQGLLNQVPINNIIYLSSFAQSARRLGEEWNAFTSILQHDNGRGDRAHHAGRRRRPLLLLVPLRQLETLRLLLRLLHVRFSKAPAAAASEAAQPQPQQQRRRQPQPQQQQQQGVGHRRRHLVELPNARWQRVGPHRRLLLMLLLLVGQLVEQCSRLLLMLLKVCRRLLLVLLKVCRCSCSCCCDYGSPSAQCLVLVLVDACDHLRRELHVAAFLLFVLHPCWSHSASHTALRGPNRLEFPRCFPEKVDLNFRGDRNPIFSMDAIWNSILESVFVSFVWVNSCRKD
jgi:hypothetical protein